jgi:uncharacterized membrane protein
MNPAHLHLMINHFPVIGLIIASAILAVALLRRSDEMTRIGAVLLVFVALITIPVYLTGEPAEHIVEDLPGASEDILHAHEDVAVYAMILIEILGAAALAGLVVFRRALTLPRWFAPGLFVLSIVAMSLVGWTSSIGGQIMHPEARPDFVVEESEH